MPRAENQNKDGENVRLCHGVISSFAGNQNQAVTCTSRIGGFCPLERRDEMNKIIENKKQLIRAPAKGYQWDSWLKIEEDVTPMLPR